MKRPEELKQKKAKNTKGSTQSDAVYGDKAMERVKQFHLARGLSIPGEASKGSQSSAKAKPALPSKGKATVKAKAMTKR